MCRIALFNKESFALFGSVLPNLSEFFSFLEGKRGGDGNGFAVRTKGSSFVWKKGLPDKLPASKAAQEMQDLRDVGEWFLFHTRKASPGLPSDASQVHPFKMGPYILCMNGTEENLISLVSEMNISDTQLILTELVLKNLPPVFLLKRKSNFAGFYGSKAFLVRNNGVDMKLYFDESLNAVVFASEFPENIKAHTLPETFYWEEGYHVKDIVTD